MDDLDSARAASASIACDPTNYDWNELDQNIFSSQTVETAIATSIAAAPGLSDIANGTAYNWRSRAFSNSDDWDSPSTAPTSQETAGRADWQPLSGRPRRQKATDKDVVDFMYRESANATMMRLCNEFIPIVESGADTLIYIGIPPQLAGQTDHEYAYIRRQFQRPYLMRSDTLRKLDSAKFKELLGPKSARTQRRLQKAGVHKLILEPQNIKYFIDLTPNIHDDEGMILLTELSAPRGARAWHQNARRFNVSSSHVCGRDALDVPPRPTYRPQSQDGPASEHEDEDQATKSKETKKTLGKGSNSSKEEQQTPEIKVNNTSEYELPQEDDYSQLRHYTAIARLLHAIAGQDPKLNSAPKVWTFCMLAKFFDCAKSNLVNRWITDWLVQSNNLNFVQVNPSTSYRLGMAIEAIWLVRSSFSIMVGQKAFANTASDLKQPSAFPFQPASHITEDLDDDEINRVDHAALALVRRVKDNVDQLLRVNDKWLVHRRLDAQLSRFHNLELKAPKAQSVLEVAKISLKRYIQRLLCTAFIEVDYSKRNTADLLTSSSNVIARYNDIPPLLRPLTLHFWESLQKEEFCVDHDDTVHLGNQKYWSRTLETLVHDSVIAPEMVDIPYVSKTELTQAVDLLNTMAFYPRPEDKESSPKKKVKLFPQQKKEQPPPIESKEVHLQPQSSMSESYFVKPTEASTQNVWDIEKQRKYSWESDSDWDNDIGMKDANIHDSENDDWEDVVGNLELQPEPKIPLQVMPAQDLPIRNKPSISQISKVPASIQENAVKATGQFEKTTSLEQSYQSILNNIANSIQEQTSPVTQNQLRDGYGNPVSPQPDKSFVYSIHNDPPTTRQPLKSHGSCWNCSLRRIKCDGACLDCGQCTRSGHFCESAPPHLRGDCGPSPLGVDTYAQPSTFLDPQFQNSTYKPKKPSFETSNVKNSRNSRPESSRARGRVGALYSNLDTTPLSNDMVNAIQPGNQYRRNSSPARSSGLRVTNPDDLQTEPTTTKPQRSASPERDFFFFVPTLLFEIHDCVERFVTPLTTPGYVTDGSCAYEIPIDEVGVLTSLTQDEYKYLPLWAGGNDDGTGGVFDDGDEIPEAPEVEDGGFRGGAMGIIPGVGSSIGGSVAGSEFEEIMTEVGVSTVGKASRIATDGEETVMSLDE